MNTAIVNDYRIELPDDMSVISEGMFDTIIYRGREICTYETDGEPGAYAGPFAVSDADGFDHSVSDLAAARVWIDRMLDGAGHR